MLKTRVEKNPWDQVALNYDEEVISPLYHATYNPLHENLLSMKNKSAKVIGDLGCGTGPMLPHLSENFKQVYALDYSPQMLKLAFEKMQNYPDKQLKKICFEQGSLTQLSKLEGMLDVALTINSVIMTDFSDLKKAFSGIYNTLKKKGQYLAILPSLEAIQEEFHHTYQKELKKYNSSDMAQASTRKKLEARRINFELGTYNTGDMIQKYYTRYELESYLIKAGFKNICFDRVVYDREYSYNYVDNNLKAHPFMWDHFVICEK
ncbi:MAG: class I SAM-dependent methyltransferase [Bacteriovoracaceae bacterium]